MTLNVGDRAPNFTLQTDENHAFTLSDHRGKKIILYFYPKDNTPGCTKQACDFRDKMSEFTLKNTLVVGVSRDTTLSHEKFKEKYHLPFTLLSDPDGDVCEAYGIINKKSLFGKTFLGIERSTFHINEEGIISVIWRKVKVNGHIDKVLNENYAK